MKLYSWLLVQGLPECSSDGDCPISDKCHQGDCINACFFEKCGANTRCETTFHDASCLCLENYSGNPNIACHPRKEILFTKFLIPWYNEYFCVVAPATVAPITAGCDNNDECPEHTACRNRLCINPCAYDDPCASNAICIVTNHNPVCTCPDGYIGDPSISCELRND